MCALYLNLQICYKTLVLATLLLNASTSLAKKFRKSYPSVYHIYPVAASRFTHYSAPVSAPASVYNGPVAGNGLIDEQGCGQDKLFVANFEICGYYFKCTKVGTLPNGNPKYKRENFECPPDESYDMQTQSCRIDRPCSLLYPYTRVPEDWPSCPRIGKKLQVPEVCSDYYICWWTGQYYTLTYHECPPGLYFNEYTQSCERTKSCPQEWIGKPPTHECNQRPSDYVVNPANCAQYYQCQVCTDVERPEDPCTCLEFFECEEEEIVDLTNPSQPQCKRGTCAPPQKKLPSGYKCDATGALHVHPSDCKKYYKCFLCKKLVPDEEDSYCYNGFEGCPGDTWFDDVKKTCIKSRKCPQDLMELPKEPGYKCSNDGEQNVHPQDCSQYYLCIKCSKPSGWCYEPLKCSMGTLWDDLQKKCVIADSCPQTWKPLPPEPGWNCAEHQEKNQVPNKCNEFYTCIRCDRQSKWCYTQHKCPDGQTFDEDIMECVHGRCPQWPDILPKNWTCKVENELEVDPTDCSRFYRCVKCPDNNPWCYFPDSCPAGQYFDERQKKCVVHDRCPGEDKEILQGFKCRMDGEVHVWPDDCRKYYECYKCSQPKGWCYEENICPPGETFDDILGLCVLGQCPQNKTELPKGPGWYCTKTGDMNVVPGKGNCTKYYLCEACSKPGGWCYTQHECAEGQSFDDTNKICVIGRCPQEPPPIPENFNCSKAGEVHAYPEEEHCDKYYECVWTGDYYTWTNYECPSGQFFDEILKTCGDPPCPQQLKEIGPEPEWKCNEQGELSVLPANCQQYFECYQCSKPRGWCYLDIQVCPTGSNFDQIKKDCVPGPCPQNRPEITDNMTCSTDLELNVWPTDCKKYYVCHRCLQPKGWCYETKSCPGGQTFDVMTKTCVPGRCPQLPPKLPAKWFCNVTGEKWVVPEDCTKFYTCLKCEDGPWCYKEIESCPSGFTFDNEAKECIRGRCPQYPEFVPPTWPQCQDQGQLHVSPENCTFYFKCLRCPDADAWCFTLLRCKDGFTFDNKNKKCVEGRCRQWPPKLPSGYNCSGDGDLEVDPNSCSQYYKCLVNCPDADWCYAPGKCPSGYNFDRTKKLCVEGPCPQQLPEVPESKEWHKCLWDGYVRQFPGDCSSYYECKRCDKGIGWCYQKHHCAAGETFDDDTRVCVVGRCPQWPEKMPKGLNCKKEGDKFGNPDTRFCYEYFKCVKCPDGGWCYDLKICPKECNFNDKTGDCRKGGKCVRIRRNRGRSGIEGRSGGDGGGDGGYEDVGVHPANNCYAYAHVGQKKPDKDNCYCYYQCGWFLIVPKWQRECCKPGSYYQQNGPTAGWCVKGSCDAQSGRGGGFMEIGPGPGQPGKGWQVQTFSLGK